MLRTFGWLLALVLSTIPCYWLVVHPKAEFWRLKRGARFRVLAPLWVVMWILACLATIHWRRVLLYDAPWAWIPAAFFFAVSLYLYLQAHLSFGQLIGRPEVQG